MQHWDIFCRVVDNFGDIGVSLRLARQLAAEHGLQVRLWVDHMASLQALCPSVRLDATKQVVAGVTVFPFSHEADFAQPADVVIEAFGCGLPPAYVQAMAGRAVKPLWIILEYLSAEPWVREHHGLPSPHPQLNLSRFFYFPGFDAGTGGLLREADLLQRREAFDEAARRAFWAHAGFDATPNGATVVSLFAYAHAPYRALLEAFAVGDVAVVAAIPQGPLAMAVREQLQCGTAASASMGNLEVRFVPFLPQADYDQLLWACDANFVRGEDSFVRAQWAGRPFVWQIYPQAENAHHIKLDAFLDVYCAGLPASANDAVRGLWHAWNGIGDDQGEAGLAAAWRVFNAVRDAQRENLGRWVHQLVQHGDLSGDLVKFCRKMV